MKDRRLTSDDPLAVLFMIREGPTISLADLEPICKLLSRRFKGELWSYGAYEADLKIGRMRIRVVRDRSSSRLVNFVNFARIVMRRARDLHGDRLDRLVVTSYDPFKGGLLAWRVSRLLRGAFLCEVNGVFGNRDNFSHISFAPWRWFRLLQVRILGAFVLHRADAVRLLYSGQLESFVTLSNATVVRQFFDLTYTDRFYSAQEEPLILAAGFPFKVKGVDILARAFCRIAPHYPTWNLVLIGHLIPDELQAHGLGHPQIQALRGMAQQELAKWVSRCSIIVLASRSEAMGRILLEGGAAGKCRVASRVGGIPTVLEHGVDGLLFEKENVLELAETLERVIEDHDLRHRLGAAARDRVERSFSESVYLEKFTELVSATLVNRETRRSRSHEDAGYGA
jgi:glycosyltransferase involved in cell wall biosynthesis